MTGEIRAEVDPAAISEGRKITARLAGLVGAIGVGGVFVYELVNPVAGAVMVSLSVAGEAGLGYLYYDGDGDLSPHRDQARHFSQPETELV